MFTAAAVRNSAATFGSVLHGAGNQDEVHIVVRLSHQENLRWSAMTTSSPSPDSPRKRPPPIAIASFLCYAWGIILLVLSLVVLLPLLSRPRTLIAALGFLSIVIIIGAVYCLSGYLIRRRGRFGAWFTGAVVVLTTALQVDMHLNFEGVDMKPPWLIVNALLVILLLAHWARFGERNRTVGV